MANLSDYGKLLKTRLILKSSTYAEWKVSTLNLLPGEAFFITASTDANVPNGLYRYNGAEAGTAFVDGALSANVALVEARLNSKDEQRLVDVEEAIRGLTEGGEGSVSEQIATAKSEIIGDAAEDYNTLGKLEDAVQKVAADAKSYEIVAITEGLGENVKEAFKLVDEDGTQAGATINIYKDSSLKSVTLEDQKLVFTYILADGTEDPVEVDVSKFLAEAEFKNGLAVAGGEVSVKIDETSETFLTVGEGGVKLAGVQDAIDSAVQTAIEGLDVDAVELGAGETVKSISEADGKIVVEKQTISVDAKTQVTNLASIATTGSTDDLVQGEQILILDCGNATA